MLLALKITRGFKVTLSVKIYLTINIKVQVFIVLTSIAFKFSFNKLITNPFIL
jgi:hypothetical protein